MTIPFIRFLSRFRSSSTTSPKFPLLSFNRFDNAHGSFSICVRVACTFLGPSRKRGPPKGYIDAIEARLHQTEALLGIVLSSSDERAQTLLHDLSQVRPPSSLTEIRQCCFHTFHTSISTYEVQHISELEPAHPGWPLLHGSLRCCRRSTSFGQTLLLFRRSDPCLS